MHANPCLNSFPFLLYLHVGPTIKIQDAPRKILLILGMLFFITAAGSIGYHLIEGWPYFDALYMTVITLATVGYGETHPLSIPGRVFTLFLIMGGMGFLLYSITEATAFLVEGEMSGYLRRRKMNKAIRRLSHHYILCGYGLKGQHILDELIRTKRKCVVVESHPDKVRKLLEKSVLVVEGDATDDSILKSAGIERAAGLVASLPTDKDNLFVVITARGLNKNLRIVAKVDDLDARDKFLRSGADAVVSANFIGGLRMASELIRPDAVNFLDSMLRDNSALRVEDVRIGAQSKFVGKQISQCDVLQNSHILVFSIKRDGDYEFNPRPNTLLQVNDTLVLIGYPEEIKLVRNALIGHKA